MPRKHKPPQRPYRLISAANQRSLTPLTWAWKRKYCTACPERGNTAAWQKGMQEGKNRFSQSHEQGQ